jgi:hypothetical protein
MWSVVVVVMRASIIISSNNRTAWRRIGLELTLELSYRLELELDSPGTT